MGFFDSKSSTTNENYDQRVINDNSGATLDNSTRFDNSVDVGAYGNNTGSITVTDGGAFNVVGKSNSLMAGLLDTLGLYNAQVSQDALSVGAGALSDATMLVDNIGDRSLSATMAANDTLGFLADGNNDLTRDLATINADALTNQQDDNNDALNSGFKGMLQFAENFSRSDGNELAKTNMQTIGLVMGGVAVVAAAFYFMKGKK